MRRSVAVMVAMILLTVACGGDGQGAQHTSTQASEGNTSAPVPTSGDDPGPADTVGDSPSAEPGCTTDEICELELPYTEIDLQGHEGAELAVADGIAYLVAEDGSVIIVDLAAGSVSNVLELEPGAVDIAVDGGEVWVLTLDGPALLDPESGALSNQGTLARAGSGSHLALGDDRVWVTTNGTGEVTPFNRGNGNAQDPITDYDNVNVSDRARVAAVGGHIYAVDRLGGRLISIDSATREIETIYDDLGHEAEADGDYTTILASGPESVITAEGSVWVLSNLVNPEGEFVSGVGAVYRIDPAAGTVEKTGDLVGDPESDTSFVVTSDAVWYIELTSVNPVRLDRSTGLQHRVRLGYLSGYAMAEEGGIVWVAAGPSLVGIDESEASSAVAGAS